MNRKNDFRLKNQKTIKIKIISQFEFIKKRLSYIFTNIIKHDNFIDTKKNFEK